MGFTQINKGAVRICFKGIIILDVLLKRRVAVGLADVVRIARGKAVFLIQLAMNSVIKPV